MKHFTLLFAFLATLLTAEAQEKIILLDEGNWQTDNGRMTYFENGRVVSNEWFREINGIKLGDTPNDIIQINDDLIAIAINWSNIVQFITPEGRAVAATEDVPNNRKLASDGRYVYISSYGHECKVGNRFETFTRGFVAKIDVTDFKVVAAVEVGWEPEGIALYDGKLFVANTGGYAFNEDHEYETTVSVIDAETMKIVRTVDTGIINLYGKMSQSGRYLLINSPGDYYDTPACCMVFDCRAALDGRPDNECFTRLEYASTYSTTTTDGKFFAIGSRFSYYTMQYTFNYITVDPALVMDSGGSAGVEESMPGTMKSDIKKMTQPYGIYVNPYTGYMYATDAGEFIAGGALYQWDPQGRLLGTWGVYINPAHFLALPPDGHFQGVGDITIPTEMPDGPVYNLQGMPVSHPVPGQIYIQAGRKFIAK